MTKTSNSEVGYCDFCGGEVRHRSVTKKHCYDGKVVVFNKVEAEVCEECGERYFHRSTLDELDRLSAEEVKSFPRPAA